MKSNSIKSVMLGTVMTLVCSMQTSWAEANAKLTEFKIPAQTLASALLAFSEQANVQVSVSTTAINGLKTRGVSGALTPEAALAALLNNTGLRFKAIGDRTYSVTQVGQADPKAEKSPHTGSAAETLSATYLLAQAPAESEDAADSSKASDKNKKKDDIEEMVVEENRIKAFADRNVDIPRTINDAQAYYIFDSKTIERSGALNIEDFLKQNLTMNTIAQTSSQAVTSGAFVSGPSSVNLRGMGADKTLVLINGRRAAGMPGLSLAPSSQPDLNGISMSAIERIEVLPSSASGIYGGSALGGVINVVLKKHYEGGEVRANYDNTWDTDAPSRKISMSYGTGFNGGKTQLNFNAQWGDTSLPLVQDRRELFDRGLRTILRNSPSFIYSSTSPFLGALPNITSASYFDSAIYSAVLAATGNGTTAYNAAFTPDPGTLTLKNGTALNSRLTYIPAGTARNTAQGALYAGLLNNAGTFNLDLPATTQAPSGLLRPFAFVPTTKSFMFTVRHQLSSIVELSLDLGRNENRSMYPYNPSSTLTSLSIPSSNVNSPFTSAVAITVPTMVNNPFVVNGSSDSATLAASFRFASGWSGEVDYSWSRSRLYDTYSYIDGTTMNADIASGLINPFVDLLAYPVDFNKYYTFASADLKSGLRNFALRASGPLVRLPSGPVNLTFGVEHRLVIQPPRVIVEKIPFRPAEDFTTEYFAREQGVGSGYAEVLIPLVRPNVAPLLNALELQFAGRAERVAVDAGTSYKSTNLTTGVVTYGSPTLNGLPYFTKSTYASTNITLGIKYQPLQELTLRASTATAFLPPQPSDLLKNPLPNANLSSVNDPLKNNTVAMVSTISGGNPDLKPQNSESLNAGLIWEPSAAVLQGMRFNAEYYKIRQNDTIGSLSAQQFVDNEKEYPGRVVRNAAGNIVFVDTSLVNLYARETEGWDFSANYRFKSAFGNFSIQAVESMLMHMKYQYSLVLPTYDSVNFPAEGGATKYKSNLQVLWDYRNWMAGWTVRYFSAYKQSGALGGPSATRARATNPNAPLSMTNILAQGSDTIPAQIYHDLFLSYDFSTSRAGTGRLSSLSSEILSGVTLQFGVKNVFNTLPPFDVRYDYYISPYGDTRLRSYWLNLKKSF